MSIKQFITLGLVASSALLVSCASITTGTKQNVMVKTPPVNAAECTLRNSKGEWYVKSTPESVKVHRAYDDLIVSCTKKGYGTRQRNVKSSTRGMAFGNAVFGGFVGAGVDVASGAAYLYPDEIVVPMTRKAELQYAKEHASKNVKQKKKK